MTDDLSDGCPICGALIRPDDLAERPNPLPGRSTHAGDCPECLWPVIGRLAHDAAEGWRWGVKPDRGDVRWDGQPDEAGGLW